MASGFEQFLMSYEPQIRLGVFIGLFSILAVWEWVAPRRVLGTSKRLRWTANLGLVAVDTLLLRLIFPAAAVGMAIVAREHGWGLFGYLDAPYWLAFIAGVLLLDLIIYLQHVMFHAIPALWRLHRVHHTDLDFDLSTGLRFHPIEIILSMLIKFGAVAALGPPVAAVLAFEVILNATSMFNHSNIRIPLGLDRVLRWLVVTPDMHRVHHSIIVRETNSNFGFNFPWWDRLLGTYKDQPEAGHQGMTIGIERLRDPRRVARLPGMLWLPFTGAADDYTINRRFDRDK